jgi:putative membrane protein
MGVVGCANNGQNRTASSSDVGGMDAGKGSNGMARGSATTMDRQFFMDAAAGGTYEVQSSRLALQKSNNDGVKRFAQHMIDDHTKANDELAGLARSKNVAVTPAPNQMQQDMLNRLQGLSGTQFDQEYLRQQRMAHQDTIQKFETAANSGSEDVKMWASKTLPTLRQHLQMVDQQLGGQNGAGATR